MIDPARSAEQGRSSPNLYITPAASAPAQTERMPGRVGVDLETLGGRGVGRLQHPGTQRDNFIMGGGDVVNVQVEMDLLRRAIGPLRLDVVRGELNGEPPFAVDDDAVPIVLSNNLAAHQRGPEGTFGREVSSIEDDDLSGKFHSSCHTRSGRGRTGQRPWSVDRVLLLWKTPGTATDERKVERVEDEAMYRSDLVGQSAERFVGDLDDDTALGAHGVVVHLAR